MRYRQRDVQGPGSAAFVALSGALVAAGIALRLWQFLGVSALWTDEATLANNIVSRPLGLLVLRPLANQQAAPMGYLLVEKAFVAAFGPTELALRAFPTICSIAALVLLWRAASLLLPRESVPLALAPLALAPPMLFLTTEAKQYSSDLAIATALLMVALRIGSRTLTRSRALAAMAAGMIAVWFSQSAVIVLAALGAVLLIDALASRDSAAITRVVALVCAWGTSALASVLASFDRLPAGARHYMSVFWADGFWPLSLRHPTSIAWPLTQLERLIAEELALPAMLAGIFVVCIVGALAFSWRSDLRATMLLGAPLLVALGASVTSLYPLKERLAVFLIPSMLLLAAMGFTQIARALRDPYRVAGLSGVAAALVTAVGARALHASPPVYRREEITPAITYLEQHRQPGDALYVYYGAEAAFLFYAARDSMSSASYTLGACHRTNPGAYLAELRAMRGRSRVWLLFSHELPRLHERQLMTSYLDEIGSVRDSVIVVGHDVDGTPTRASLFLYDLSDTTRGAQQEPRHVPVPALEVRLHCSAELV